ncbi:MAG TPA: hydrogenase iron-sulfur subunit, partial [Candidatus Limnocylindrales bacterium]
RPRETKFVERGRLIMSTDTSDATSAGQGPRILVFSTNTISDPGIDLAGSSHMSYSPGVMVISLPCTSGIRPSWILHAIERGFDGVFVASDGDECAYLPDCSERASHIVAEAQTLLRANGHSPQRLKLAAICSVCAEPFTRHVAQFGETLAKLPPEPLTAAVA